MILTIPVLLYQLFFVLALYVASRFGKTALNVVTILCLLWTATHLFFVPLAVLQTVVLIGSYLLFKRRLVATSSGSDAVEPKRDHNKVEGSDESANRSN